MINSCWPGSTEILIQTVRYWVGPAHDLLHHWESRITRWWLIELLIKTMVKLVHTADKYKTENAKQVVLAQVRESRIFQVSTRWLALSTQFANFADKHRQVVEVKEKKRKWQWVHNEHLATTIFHNNVMVQLYLMLNCISCVLPCGPQEPISLSFLLSTLILSCTQCILLPGRQHLQKEQKKSVNATWTGIISICHLCLESPN